MTQRNTNNNLPLRAFSTNKQINAMTWQVKWQKARKLYARGCVYLYICIWMCVLLYGRSGAARMAESVKNEINKSLTFVIVIVIVVFKAESEKMLNHYDLHEVKCTSKLVLMIAHKHTYTHAYVDNICVCVCVCKLKKIFKQKKKWTKSLLVACLAAHAHTHTYVYVCVFVRLC